MEIIDHAAITLQGPLLTNSGHLLKKYGIGLDLKNAEKTDWRRTQRVRYLFPSTSLNNQQQFIPATLPCSRSLSPPSFNQTISIKPSETLSRGDQSPHNSAMHRSSLVKTPIPQLYNGI